MSRVTFFMPCTKRPESVDVEHEWIDNPCDGSFAEAFSFGTVDDATVAAIDAAPGALVLYSPHDLGEGREDVLALVRGLPEAIAVRVEQSKLGWSREQWLAMIGSETVTIRLRAVVAQLSTEAGTFSCGMHAFSLPDTYVAYGDEESESTSALVTAFNAYQLGEDPLLLSGQTFSLAPDAPRQALQRCPDTGYPQGHPCQNPYGVWHLGAPGVPGRGTPQLASVFVPTLVALLTALEAKNGAPLTREQVEAARDSAPCIAMEHRDARAMDRKRGYSDIDPELAWEHWQMVRDDA